MARSDAVLQERRCSINGFAEGETKVLGKNCSVNTNGISVSVPIAQSTALIAKGMPIFEGISTDCRIIQINTYPMP